MSHKNLVLGQDNSCQVHVPPTFSSPPMTCFNGNGLLLAYTPFDVGCENFVFHVYRETKKLFFFGIVFVPRRIAKAFHAVMQRDI